MRGFVLPKDIFRNPESIFRYFENTQGDSPFDITVSNADQDFSVIGMHFKVGLYEHQSARALEGLQKMIFDSKFTQNNKRKTSKTSILLFTSQHLEYLIS